MALSQEQAAEVWDLFGSSPLFAKWPEARQELASLLDVIQLAAGTPVFSPGDAPECLYLVGAGVVRQTLRRDNPITGPIWLELRHESGDYFGQHAVFAGRHESSAFVMEDTRLYRMEPRRPPDRA